MAAAAAEAVAAAVAETRRLSPKTRGSDFGGVGLSTRDPRGAALAEQNSATTNLKC
jgi:hypothetical protein